MYVVCIRGCGNSHFLNLFFREFGSVESVQIVHDRMSGRSRGFGFVYFTSTRDATKAKEHLKDVVIDGMKVRVDYSVTRTGGYGYILYIILYLIILFMFFNALRLARQQVLIIIMMPRICIVWTYSTSLNT